MYKYVITLRDNRRLESLFEYPTAESARIAGSLVAQAFNAVDLEVVGSTY